MGKFYETVPEHIAEWTSQQNVFWVASAPLSSSGHVNVSPKGGKEFGLLDEKTFWYGDLTGSGIETASHLHETGNGRIVIMFNAFDGAPRIVRFWGKGTVLEYGSSGYDDFLQKHKVHIKPGTRSIILVDIHQVGSSCGFSMPRYDFKDFRPTLDDFISKRVASEQAGRKEDGIERYWAYKNALSMDNLPGLKRGVATARKDKVEPIEKMVGPFAPRGPTLPRRSFDVNTMMFVALLAFLLGLVVAPRLSPVVNDATHLLIRSGVGMRSAEL